MATAAPLWTRSYHLPRARPDGGLAVVFLSIFQDLFFALPLPRSHGYELMIG
jgi:hypothetical protein